MIFVLRCVAYVFQRLLWDRQSDSDVGQTEPFPSQLRVSGSRYSKCMYIRAMETIYIESVIPNVFFFLFTILMAVVMFGYMMLYLCIYICIDRAIVQAMTVCAVGLGTNDTVDDETVSHRRAHLNSRTVFLSFDEHKSYGSFIISKSICASSYRHF